MGVDPSIVQVIQILWWKLVILELNYLLKILILFAQIVVEIVDVPELTHI